MPTTGTPADVVPLAPAATTIPVSSIAISNGMFSTLSNDSKFSHLCLSKDNWPKWSEKMLEVMQMTELDEYLTGGMPIPDNAVDPVSFRNWNGNNKKLVGFLKAHVESGEKPFLASDNAQTAWSELLKRHEKQGPITQVRLIQEALSISYPKDVTGWSAVSERIRDLCTRIFAQAVPTHDTMLMVVMLNALEREADHIRSEMTSYYVSNPNSTSAALSSRVEQEVLYKTRRETSSDSALAMRTAKNFRRTQKICTNPTCPHKIGHLYPDCHGPGGPMEGRRDEVIAKIAKAKEERDKKAKVTGATTPSATGIHHDKSGRAYLLDSESGQAVFLASTQPQPSTPDVALAALTTDPIPRDWYNNMSAADQSEYEALFIEEHLASVDWSERRRAVASDAFLASSPNYDSRSKLSSDAGPFILDSGATIHISPDAGDFFDLKPIPPRMIKGVGGSSINATGIGKIRLHIAGNHTITLDPALFVPEAAVRLMSVLVLGKGPQKLISHFDGDGCWLTNRFGTTIASGKLSNIGRQLYSIDIGTPLTEHGYFATRVPDLETWHRRLGHVNYRSIVDMSDNQMTRGMHVDLSSAPPKCQSCILGKPHHSVDCIHR